MSQAFFKLIQTGATADVAAGVEADPTLAQSRDPQGVSALLWSVYMGQELTRNYLLAQLAAQGVALDIFEAAATGDLPRIEEILRADPHEVLAFAGDGWTPLHLAAAFGTPAAVVLLLDHAAPVDAVSQNPAKNQPLHATMALSKNAETARLLLDRGADPNALQAGGFTAIYSALAANRKDLVELLLAHGANPRHRSDQGKTPAEFARDRGHSELAEWLETQAA